MGRKSKHPAEVRERAVRLVFEQAVSHGSQWAAITAIAPKLGCTALSMPTEPGASLTSYGVSSSHSGARASTRTLAVPMLLIVTSPPSVLRDYPITDGANPILPSVSAMKIR